MTRIWTISWLQDPAWVVNDCSHLEILMQHQHLTVGHWEYYTILHQAPEGGLCPACTVVDMLLQHLLHASNEAYIGCRLHCNISVDTIMMSQRWIGQMYVVHNLRDAFQNDPKTESYMQYPVLHVTVSLPVFMCFDFKYKNKFLNKCYFTGNMTMRIWNKCVQFCCKGTYMSCQAFQWL